MSFRPRATILKTTVAEAMLQTMAGPPDRAFLRSAAEGSTAQ
jgi:hypothetical protein